MAWCYIVLNKSQIPHKIKIPNYFCEQRQKDSSLSIPGALISIVSSLRTGPQTWNPCPLIRNIPEPSRDKGKISRDCLYSSSLWTAHEVRAESSESTLYFVTEIEYGRLLCFVPMSFRDSWWELQLCTLSRRQSHVCGMGCRRRVKAGEFNITNDLIF